MEKTFNLVINEELVDQLLSDPQKQKALESHCEGIAEILGFHEVKITDKPGRVVYTSNNV